MGVSPAMGVLVERAARALRAAGASSSCSDSYARGDGVRAAAAPGRVNLIGEHTDYNGGFVLPIAIDRWTVAVGRATSGPSRLVAADLKECATLDWSRGISPDRSRASDLPRWVRYVAGIVEGFRCAGTAVPNLALALASDVPVGGGLSSSAALGVAVATLIERLIGVRLGGIAKARLVQRSEHEFAQVRCGIMDMYTSAMGREGCALLIDCLEETHRAIGLGHPATRPAILVANSNVRHELASGEYGNRRAACERAAAKLGVERLRDLPAPVALDMAALARSELSRDEASCVRHVRSEIERAIDGATALGEQTRVGYARFGRLMQESHASLRDDYRVSCAELDRLVDLASGVPGVFGARMTGGGFGGCVIAMCEPDAAAPLRAAWLGGYRSRYGRPCDVFEVKPVDGAESLPEPRLGAKPEAAP
ncbi:MAG: galactokinase [Phycisphaerae bacterium]|nr:galactokinase [Phycisphaerae bacterium]